MKFRELLLPFYLCTGLLRDSSAESLSPSNNPSPATGADQRGGTNQNGSQEVSLGPNPDYLNVGHGTNKSVIKLRDGLDLSLRKEWEGEKVVVEVQKCAGADASLSAHWLQVPQLFQVPLSKEKAERIRGRFRNGLFNFTLVVGEGELPCVNESTMERYSFSMNKSARNREGKERAPLTWKYTNFNDYFSPYGDLKTVNHGYQYPPSTYCLSSVTAEAIGVEICNPRERNSAQGPSTRKLTREESVVITKCCSPGLVLKVAYNATSGGHHVTCIEAFEEEWTPYFFRKFATLASGFGYSASDTDAGVTGKQRPYYRHKKLICNSSIIQEFFPDERLSRAQPLKVAQIRILESGEILIRPTGQHEWGRPKETPTSRNLIDPTNICIDGLVSVGVNDVTPLESTYKRSPNRQVILYCPQSNKDEDLLFKASLVNFSISCVTSVFLAITVVVYILIWKSANIHARTSAAFSVFVLLFHLSTALSTGALVFAHQHILLIHSHTCVAIAVVNLFSYIGMFSWMTILNFDLWVTLRTMTPAARRSRGTKRFWGYCLFGLGAPLIVVSVALGFEHGFGLFEERAIRPLFGRFACVVDPTAFISYHSYPCLLLFLVNAVFATLTIITLYTWKKDTRPINKSNSKASRSQVTLVCKLFLLMGLSWTLDLLGWFVAGTDLTWYWIIFDAYNILQGLGLCWIFVFKKEVKDELCKSYAPIKSALDWMDGALKRDFSSSTAPDVTSSHSTGPTTTNFL